MFVYVKTLSGDLLTISCPLGTTHSDLPFLVHDLIYRDLNDSSVETLHHLHLIPEGSGLVEDGQSFYLLVEDPQIHVSIEVCGMAVTQDEEEESSQMMDHYSIRISVMKGGDEIALLGDGFYTPVAHVWVGNRRVKRYSNVYYTSDAVRVIYEDDQHAVVDILPGTTAHHRPNVFASRAPIPSYELAIYKEIDRVWMEHVRSTGEPELYPIQYLYRS